MTANHDLDRRIAAFYATEAPSRAPDRVLATALETIDITPQRRALVRVPWRFPRMNTYAKVAVAAVVVIAVGAVGLTVLGLGRSPGPGAVPSPTASTPPSATPRPEATATRFRTPFAFLPPEGPDLGYGPRTETHWEVRIPEWGDAGHPAGVIVQAIDGGRSDPCTATSTTLPIDAGPQAVIDYLETVPELTVSGGSPASVDGLPAVEVGVEAGPGTAVCPALWLWGTDVESWPPGIVMRLIAVDVGDEHLVLAIFGEADNPSWPAMADAFIASIRFVPGF